MPNATRFIIASKDIDFCKALRTGLANFPQIDLIIQVGSQDEAENKIQRTSPTVMLLDVDTVPVHPVLLERLTMRYENVLVVLTAVAESSAKHLLRGTIRDYARKPPIYNTFNVNTFLRLILERLGGLFNRQGALGYKDISRAVTVGGGNGNQKIIAVAASTGGVEALERVIKQLPVTVPPIVVVQHMPSGFTNLLANRLNALYPLSIKEAHSGDFLLQGQVLFAPADKHMRVVQRQGKLAVDCFLGSKIHGVMPAADILFESVAELVRHNAIGVVLTGMGADGARGLMLMHNAGAKTITQNEETCIVYGMPKVAKDLGAVDFELPLDAIANKIMALV